MAKKPAWKRKMTPSQRLEYEIQMVWRLLNQLSESKGFVDENWRKGMLRYWAKEMKVRLTRWRKIYFRPYKITEPVSINILKIGGRNNVKMDSCVGR